MRKFSFWTIFILSLALFSCKKDENNTPTPAEKFMSFTTGSTWQYTFTNNPSTTPVETNYTLTATANDSVANGRTYKIFTNSSGPNEYYNITGSDYYTFRKLPDLLGGTSIEVLYLKDNLGVNGTWTQVVPINYSGFPIQLTLNNKIAEKGITKTVSGKTYNDVTKVTTTLSVSGLPFSITLVSDIEYYYAPKVGQIENKTKIDLNFGGSTTSVDQKTELENATIL